MDTHPTAPVGRKKGFLLQDAMMAVALAMAGVVGLAHLLGVVASQRRTAGQQATAVREAGNLMEVLASAVRAQLSPDEMVKVRLSEDCLRSLPDATLRVRREL